MSARGTEGAGVIITGIPRRSPNNFAKGDGGRKEEGRMRTASRSYAFSSRSLQIADLPREFENSEVRVPGKLPSTCVRNYFDTRPHIPVTC